MAQHDISAAGTVVARWPAAPAVTRLASLPRFGMVGGILGAAWASASRDRTVCLWAAGGSGSSNSSVDPLARLVGHTRAVTALAAAGCGTKLASGSHDTTVRVWDLSAGGAESFRGHAPHNLVTSAIWAPSLSASGSGGEAAEGGALLWTGAEDGRVRLWDVRASAHAVLALDGLVFAPLALDASADGTKLIAACGGLPGLGAEARLWDVRAAGKKGGSSGGGTLPLVIAAHELSATACLLLPGGAAAVTAAQDGTVKLWDAATGTCLATHAHGGGSGGGYVALVPLGAAARAAAAAGAASSGDDAHGTAAWAPSLGECLAAAPSDSTLLVAVLDNGRLELIAASTGGLMLLAASPSHDAGTVETPDREQGSLPAAAAAALASLRSSGGGSSTGSAANSFRKAALASRNSLRATLVTA